MDNKNKKTFGDLFSSLSIEEEKDTKKELTFDNIFEQVKEKNKSEEEKIEKIEASIEEPNSVIEEKEPVEEPNPFVE